MKPPVGLSLSNCLSCLARSSEVMAHMFGPPGKKEKTKKQNKSTKKTRNNQTGWKLSKVKHVTCKIKTWLSQETKLDVDTPSSYQFGKDIVQYTNLLPRCASRAETIPRPQCFTLGFQTSSVVLQSWCRAASCGGWLFAARAGCVSPSPVWAKHSPGSLMNKWHSVSPRFSCTGLINTLQVPKRFMLVLSALKKQNWEC